MVTIYGLIADPEWAEILTLLTISLLCLAYLSFIWGNAKKLNKRLSTFEWGVVYSLGLVSFLTGVTIFGKFVVPQNADSLLATLGLEGILNYLTLKFQNLLLGILRPLM